MKIIKIQVVDGFVWFLLGSVGFTWNKLNLSVAFTCPFQLHLQRVNMEGILHK